MIGQRTTVGGGTKKMTVKSDSALLSEHREWVEAYLDTTRIAAAGYPAPLTQDQRDAYGLLPALIDECRKSYYMLPDEIRPIHYLSL